MGIDENLPIFYYKASKENVRQDATIYLKQYDDSTPAYSLRYPDPTSADARNRYAAALYDCYNPDVLYGEVLVVPDWAQGVQSEEQQRRTPGAPARPEPTLPTKCTIQLYNPDQQVVLHHQPSKWNAYEMWDFELPQETFRQPSASALDHGRSDPAALEETPVIPLKWKRDGKMSKDITCYLSGQTRNPDGSKKKQKEPDIPLAFFKSLKEITIYEPNLSRVEIEDPKGFEVVLLLGATLIRDIYHGSLAQAFNISDGPYRRASAEGRSAHQPPPPSTLNKPLAAGAAAAVAAGAISSPPPQHGAGHYGPGPYPGGPYHPQQPAQHTAATTHSAMNVGAPPTDARTQWELEAETARLRKEAEREARHKEHQKKKDEKKNAKAAQKIAEEEERAARARQAAIEAETARLRQQYGAHNVHNQNPQQSHQQNHHHQNLNAPPPPLPPRQPSPALRPSPSPKPDKKKDKKDKHKLDKPSKHGHSSSHKVPSVPTASFLSPPLQYGPPRPVSATGFVGQPRPSWHGPPQPSWHGPPPQQAYGPPPPGWGMPPQHQHGHSNQHLGAPALPQRPRSASDVGRKKESVWDRIL